jgi:hypothetical protein
MAKTNRGPMGGAGDEAGGQHRRALAVIEKLGKEVADRPTPELQTLLEAIRLSTDPPFECRRCGAANPASSDSCASCHVVTRRPSAQRPQRCWNATSAATPRPLDRHSGAVRATHVRAPQDDMPPPLEPAGSADVLLGELANRFGRDIGD